MINNTIYQRIDNFEFKGYEQTIVDLLSYCEIVPTTIEKILNKLKNGDMGPLFVYRRAVIFCSNDNCPEIMTKDYLKSYPLVIVLTPKKITLLNSSLGEIDCTYDKISDNLEYLKPLHEQKDKKDIYSTEDLATLISSLYRELILSDNNEELTQKFLFSLLYMAHYISILNLDFIRKSINRYENDNINKLDSVCDYFVERGFPYTEKKNPNLIITKEAYNYIFAIIKYDTDSIDAEILTSLIYKITQKDNAGLYGHKTSTINIMKLLKALLLDELEEKLESCNKTNIQLLINEIKDIVIFDPTNSPGCYLVSAYYSLYELLLKARKKYEIPSKDYLKLRNFIGLTENDITKKLSELALFYAHTRILSNEKVQLDVHTFQRISNEISISKVDELATNWEEYFDSNRSFYIVGSPEFKGYHKATSEQKASMNQVFQCESLNGADYSSTWLIKSSQIINGSKGRAAFVLTNSVAQGRQAPFILNKINENNCEYIFAYESFKWKTADNDSSEVTVVIIGIGEIGRYIDKKVYNQGRCYRCKEIGPTLLPDLDIRIKERSSPLSICLPPMRKGNMPDKATFLTFTSEELDDFLEKDPKAEKFIKSLYGGDEFVKGQPKWVLWINDNQLEEAMEINGISRRIEQVRTARNQSGSTSSKKSKENPHKFRETNCTNPGMISVVVPCVTSENREYFQMGILDSNSIVNNNINVIFNCDIWVLALLESRMHLVWAKNAAGGHETRPRYSSQLCYNTFPVPVLSEKQKATLSVLSRTLLEIREKYCDRSLGDMYKNMPPELAKIHCLIDETVDSMYSNDVFTCDTERLKYLKTLYNTLLTDEESI